MNRDLYDRAPAAMGEESTVSTQNAFINRVFGWMAAGLGLTGLIAYAVAHSSAMMEFLYNGRSMIFLLFLVEVILVVALSAAINKISATTATAIFLFYAALNGLTLSGIFLVYQINSIAATFFITCGVFGAMGLYGYVTKRDLTSLGSLLFMALIGLIIASVVNMFFFSAMMDRIICWVGVLIFVGLTAYDTQKIKEMSLAVSDGRLAADVGRKYAVLGALTLYLDFINIFLYLLRLFGNRRD